MRIAILGAGPIGLEAALHARSLGHSVSIFERGDAAANIASWDFVRLFSPWRMNTTELGRSSINADLPLDHCPTGSEFRKHYLLPLAAVLAGSLHTETTVLAVGREGFSKGDEIAKASRASSPFRILVRNAGEERIERADVVLDCTGTYGHARFAGRGGIPAAGELALCDRIHYTIPDVLGRDRASFADRHTLVIGSGFSAATIVRNFDDLVRRHPQTRLTWATRRPGQATRLPENDPLSERRGLVERMLQLTSAPPPWLQCLGNAALESISFDGRLFSATLESHGTDLALTVHNVISLVGYSPDASIYEQLQIHQCYATGGPIKLAAALLGEGSTDCLTAGRSTGPDTLKSPEPNFFILGSKSYGTNSHFLLQIGHKQVRDVFQLIGRG